MRLTKLIYSTLFFITAGALTLQAQETKTDKKDENKAVTEEIEVVRPYKPVLAEAVKLRRSPDLNTVKTYKAKFNYSLTDRKLGLNSDINKLQAQQVAEERAAELLNNYVKAGFGAPTTALLEGYVNIGRDEALQAGAFFRHFGQSGKLEGQDANQQQLSVFGRSIGETFTLSGRINYQRNGINFYGFNPSQPEFNLHPERQTLNFIEAEGEIVNKFTDDPDAFSYAAKINGYIWNDKYEAKEKSVVINGYVNKRISSFNLGLASSVELGNTQDQLTDVGNNIFKLNPYIKLQANGVKINAGINFVQEFGDFSSSRIFPAVTADFTLIPDYLQIFGELKGDVNRNSMKAFTDENPFLNANINIKNSIEKFSFSGGIKGTGGPGFGYKARIYHKKIADMPLFVNNFENPTRFDVIYDFGNMKQTGLEGEISIQVSNSLKWTGKLNFDDYQPAEESNSWFKPQMRLSSDLLFNITDKIAFNASVAIQDASKAKIYTAAPASPYLVPDPANETVVEVKGFVDLGAGASYKINNKFSAFARVNNLLGTKYSRFLYYPTIGGSVFGGLSYSF
ncbi:probable integral outer membrane protein [Pedobacter sp. BAL39]|uniref:TonB-dependent receptor n=1 Tax=Pedobacter sp. BAL39 TaxID=391596 RepID=UPI000155984A|nr:TonB-dependent receptor [Pedobacter sp. BAL39]EDM35749.1 probable integral outer membrane protein [Pedobacter sp. BAL39]